MSFQNALRALHTLAGHELNEAALHFSRQLQAHSVAEQQAREAAEKDRLAQDELARLMRAARLHPETYDTVRRMRQAPRQRLLLARKHLAQADQALEAARSDLARSRQREADMAQALSAERSASQRAAQVREDTLLDDLWLQSNRSRA